VNFVVADVSCGLRPDYYIEDLMNPFAGVSTIATIMPARVQDDTWDTWDRGPSFAHQFTIAAGNSIAQGWLTAINNTTGGGSCPFGGGSHGIDGCGAHVVVSADSSIGGASWAVGTENWTQVRNDGNDPTGDGFYAWSFMCNYNCSAHPFYL
jgi:hypothetical protein